MIDRCRLDAGWTVTPADGAPVPPHIAAAAPVPATVPGSVQVDLLAAGLVPDPFRDDNEDHLRWIGRSDWVYETTFDRAVAAAPRVDLVCAGLDTVATISVNGAPVARTRNMHRSYRFDVTRLLRPEGNRLRVHFTSPYTYAEQLIERLGDRPRAYPAPFNFIRKTACDFGWDWGPALVPTGIWRPVALEAWHTARLAEVRPRVTLDGTAGTVRVDLTVERVADDPLTASVEVCGQRAETTIPAGETTAAVEVHVDHPTLWWPRGYGAQNLHEVEVRLDAGDRPLDVWRRRIGFRSVRLDTAPDEHGTPYTVVVNGQPVFVRGVNWIPADALITRVTRELLRRRLADAVEANVNYLRVWGGGHYESEDFYQLADELGLLVGQDFLFACASYPEEDPFPEEVAAEAREHVVRLASHPSLVVWTGNNENIWGFHDWGWQEQLRGRTWGAGYYHRLLPSIVADCDPTRPYWPGSPYSGREDRHPNDPAHGTAHNWEVWNRVDYVHYRDDVPRFIAEFGYQGPPAYATLRRALSDDPLTPTSAGMAHHQKAEDGDGKLSRGLAAHLPTPRTFDDWHFLTQLNQARAVSLGIEHYRSHQPVCMGTVVWQLNDCWPVTSWAAVDGDGRRKPLWYALRRSYADRLATIQPRPDGLGLVLVNLAGARWSGQARVRRLRLTGEVHDAQRLEYSVAPRGQTTLLLPASVARAGDHRAEVLLAEVDEVRAWWFFKPDRELSYPPAAFAAKAEAVPGGARVTVTAETFLRDLTLFPDRLDPSATVDDALVTLLPGESTTFHVRAAGPLDPLALTRAPILRCVNDLVALPA